MKTDTPYTLESYIATLHFMHRTLDLSTLKLSTFDEKHHIQLKRNNKPDNVLLVARTLSNVSVDPVIFNSRYCNDEAVQVNVVSFRNMKPLVIKDRQL